MADERIVELQKAVDDIAVGVAQVEATHAQVKATQSLDRTIGTATSLIVTGACVIVCALQVLDWFGYLMLILWQFALLFLVRPFGRTS